MLRKSLIIGFLGLVLDQITKAYILYGLKLAMNYENGWAVVERFNHSISIIDGFFSLTLVWNHGVSFGMFNNGVGGGKQPYVLMALTAVIVCVLLLCLKKAKSKWEATAFALVISGALGNLIDRAIYGAVVDFLDFYIGTYHWPAFNVADSMILIGVLMLVFESVFVKSKNHEKS